jgi:hypothetical protein
MKSEEKYLNSIIESYNTHLATHFLLDIHSFKLKGIPQVIKIKFYKKDGDTDVYFEPSHYIIQKEGGTTLYTNITSRSSVEEIIREYLSQVKIAYNNNLHIDPNPSDEWLKENPDYNNI